MSLYQQMKQWAGQWSVQFFRGEDSNLQKDEDSKQKECPYLRTFSAEAQILGMFVIHGHSQWKHGVERSMLSHRGIKKKTICKTSARMN